MTPDVVVDIGNSRMKWGRCVGRHVKEIVAFGHDDAVAWKRAWQEWRLNPLSKWAIAGVVPKAVCRFRDWLAARDIEPAIISSDMFVEEGKTKLTTTVDEPELLGVDRLVTALAARHLAPGGQPVIAINVGTAMTIDFVDGDGTFAGGAIMPGPSLMSRSLNQYTAKLPQIAIDATLPVPSWGTNTQDAIELGIAAAVVGAADYLVWEWANRFDPKPCVYVTGGDAGYFSGFEFTADVGPPVIVPTLTLEGIRIAAEALP
jgi:type III pantothenate kinase